MIRSLLTWGLTAIAGAAFAGSASAQVFSIPNPVTGGRFNYTRVNALTMSVPSPYGGTFNYNRVYFGTPPQLAGSGAPYRSGYLSGGVATSSYTDLRTADQKQNQLAKAQKMGANPGGAARAAIADQWAYEKGAKLTAVAGPVLGGKPKGINPDLLDASAAEIASGVALNELFTAVRPLDEKATRPIDTALLPPDLAARIVFAGGPSADAVNLLRADTLEFPVAFRGPEFDALRAGLSKEYAVLGEAATQNRATVSAAADRLVAAVHKARDATAPAVRELAFPDAVEAARFFNRLDAAARLLKDPNAAPAYVPNWSSIGLTVKELVRHMGRYKLTFGPSAPSDGGAYEVLHRGLVEYYLHLAQQAGK